MNRPLDNINPDINNIVVDYGYEIKKITYIKEKELFFYELMHTVTNATHVHISCDDTENTFGVAFKTVPADSTGVAHILEHTVLCGSRKYPVRDPFFSMLKRSLSTFMNAFTASDWTMYPFSTQNRKDFYNLMDVYLNAVFFPIISELSFMQEGHRVEFQKETGDLVYKGVVYNEMKGAMSSPDQVMVRSLLNAIYPDTTYSNNSGGDPAQIPTLTYDQLKAFHERYYHPSNSYFFTYGNLPLKDHLVFIQENVLQKFRFVDPDTEVLSQPRWDKPQEFVYKYPLGKNEVPDKKYQVCVAWLTADIQNSFEIFAISLLSHVLLGNSASYLQKALIDSGLGTSLCDGCGFDGDNRDSLFVAGLKDVEKSNKEEIVSIIFDVLQDLVNNGIDKDLIESAIHQVEFSFKEVTNSPYPYGLKLLLTICSPWFHGCSPEKAIQLEADLKRLRQEMSKGRFFENLIEKYFLKNTHHAVFVLEPDKEMEEKEDNRIFRELKKKKSEITKLEINKIVNDAKNLEKLQDEKEDISSLPTLELEDVSPSVQKLRETMSYSDIPVALYNRSTSGIFYFSNVFGISNLNKELFPLVPFFCWALIRTGTKKKNYVEITRLIDKYTGGINMGLSARTSFDERGICIPVVIFNSKSLDRNQGNMFEIIEELFSDYTFSDITRLNSLLLEFRAGLESMVIHNGHKLAIQLASRNFSPSCLINEIWSGIHQLKTIKDLTDSLTDDKLNVLSEKLMRIGAEAFTQNNFYSCMIGGDDAIEKALNFANSTKTALKERQNIIPGFEDTAKYFELNNFDVENNIPQEGWYTASSVSFVAQVFKTVRMGHEDAPALTAISKILKSMYLHREIREKGGAYGGFSQYSFEDGLFSFGSYRDPHINRTLNVYQKASDYIIKGEYTDEDVKEAILQICSEIDSPDSPAFVAKKAFIRKIVCLSDEKREHFKEKLLELNRDIIIKTARRYFPPDSNQQAVAVISNEKKLKDVNKKSQGISLKLHKI